MIAQVPEIRISKRSFCRAALQASSLRPKRLSREASAIRAYLLSRGNSALADRGFHWLMVLCALSIFGIVVLIAFELVVRSQLAWGKFGLDFFYKAFIDTYTRQADVLGSGERAFQRPAVPLWYAGFLVSCAAAGGSAGHWRGRLPDRDVSRAGCAAPLAFITELLAAIPSVIYGLWAVFVLVPLLREHVNPWLIKTAWAGRAFLATTTPPVLALLRRA